MSQPSVWNKLATLFRGATHDTVQAINDKKALVILDQEIRDAATDQDKAKDALSGILAKQSLQEKSITALSNDIQSLTQKALKAQEQGSEKLALEIATVIGQKSQQRDTEQTLLDQYKAFAEKQRAIVVSSEARINTARQQADVAKARASIQSAQMNVLSSTGSTSGGLNNAMDSLNRIRARQDETDAKFEARQALDNETNGTSLEEKMKAAGLSDDKYDAASILAGLKKDA
jgi:phage shock protein A